MEVTVKEFVQTKLDLHLGDDSPDPISKQAFEKVVALTEEAIAAEQSKVKSACCMGGNYEVYFDGKAIRWGNFVISYTLEELPGLFETIREEASRQTGLPAAGVRIVNMWAMWPKGA